MESRPFRWSCLSCFPVEKTFPSFPPSPRHFDLFEFLITFLLKRWNPTFTQSGCGLRGVWVTIIKHELAGLHCSPHHRGQSEWSWGGLGRARKETFSILWFISETNVVKNIWMRTENQQSDNATGKSLAFIVWWGHTRDGAYLRLFLGWSPLTGSPRPISSAWRAFFIMHRLVRRRGSEWDGRTFRAQLPWKKH